MNTAEELAGKRVTVAGLGVSGVPAAKVLHGLGAVVTTNHLRCEDEVKQVLGLPKHVSTYALMPIGYPQGKFGPLARRPVHEVAYADRWGVARPAQ